MPSGPVDANDRLRIIYPLYLKRKCHDRFQWDDGQNQTLELELLSKSQIINVKTVKESAINCESLDVYDDGKTQNIPGGVLGRCLLRRVRDGE